MFEYQVLRMEDLTRKSAASVRDAVTAARRKISANLPWSLSHARDGRAFQFEPDSHTLGDVDISRCLEDPASMLFTDPASGSDDLIRITGNDTARDLLALNFFDQAYEYHNQQLFSGAYSLEDFIGRYVFGGMLSDGRVFVKLHWQDTNEQLLIKRLEPLEDNEIRRVRIGKHRNWYRYVRRRHHYYPPQGPEVEYLAPEDVAVFVLQPPFATRPGHTRLKSAQRLARKGQFLMDAQFAGLHAHTFNEDKRWWVERARSINLRELLDEMKLLGVRIRGVLGGLPSTMDERTTKYFDAISVVWYYERLALARESVLDQFNRQVVSRLLRSNGITEDAGGIEAVARPSADWRTMGLNFASGSLTYEELDTVLNPQNMPSATADGATE